MSRATCSGSAKRAACGNPSVIGVWTGPGFDGNYAHASRMQATPKSLQKKREAALCGTVNVVGAPSPIPGDRSDGSDTARTSALQLCSERGKNSGGAHKINLQLL